MSGSASLGVEQAMLSHTLGIGPVAAVSRAYVALCLASLVPDERVRGVEVSGNGYARMAASFQVLVSPPNMAANTTTVAFPIAAAPWGVLGYFELWDASTGGNRLYWGALVDPADGTTPITLSVSAGDVLRFSAGALGVRIGPSGSSTVGGAFLPLVGGTLASPGNLTVGGAFNVTGAAATLGGPLSVTGPTALTGGATITGESSIRSGNFTLAFDPTLPLHAATKQYVDGGGAGGGLGPFLPTTGGSLNGPGNLVVGGTLGVTGNATFSGTHAVTGVSTATGGFNGNTVFGIAGGGVGVGLTVNNTATVARLNVTGSTHVWTPSTVIDATSQAIISPGQSVTGTMGATDGSVWNFGLAGNSIDNSAAPDPFMPFKVATNFGGTKGSIGAFSINQTQTSDTLDPDGLTRFYNTLQITQNLAHRVGNQSNSVGVGIYINQAASAVGWANVEGIEVGIQRVAGTTVNAYNVIGMIATNTSGNHAVDYESYLHMFAASGSTSLNTGLLLGTPGGQWPIDPTNGWIIDTYQQKNNNPGLTQRMAQAAAGGFDFSQVNFSDSVMKSPGVRIKGIAEIDIGPASIAAYAGGAQIDVTGYKGTLGAVIANGATYQVNDQLYDGCGGIINVDTISGPGGVLTAHYLPGKEPYLVRHRGARHRRDHGRLGQWRRDVQRDVDAADGAVAATIGRGDDDRWFVSGRHAHQHDQRHPPDARRPRRQSDAGRAWS